MMSTAVLPPPEPPLVLQPLQQALESATLRQPPQSNDRLPPPPPMAPLTPSPPPRSPQLSIDDAAFAVPPPCYVEPPSYFSALGITPGASQRRPTRFACVAISGSDRLRLVGFPTEDIAGVIEVVDALIADKWEIQARTSPRQRVFEWKLKGRPWAGDSWNDNTSPIRAVRLLGSVFGGLSASGYHVSYASDISCGRDTVFVKQGLKMHRNVFTVLFRKPDTMILVDAPPIVQNLFISSLASWHRGAVGIKHQEGYLKVQLGGQLWPGPESETFAVRELLCTILAVFDELGYDQIASLDVTQQGWGLGTSQAGQLDTWFFANRVAPTSPMSPMMSRTPSVLSLSPSPASTPSVYSL